MRRSILVLTAVVFLTSVPAAPGQNVEVEVRVEGLPEQLEENVRAVSSLERASRQGGRSAATVLWFFDRASAEIELALQPFGFYQPSIEADLDRQGAPWIARFVIDPGPPTLIDAVNVRVSGPDRADEDFADAIAEFPLAVGDTLNHHLYERGKKWIAAVAAEKGYLDAAFKTHEIRVDVPRSTAEITLELLGSISMQPME